MPIDPSRFLETVDASEAAESAKVTELVDVFGASRLIREDFNRNALLQCSRTVGDLEKCIKSLSGPLSQGIFDNLWSKAYNAGSVTSGQIMTVRDLFRFKSWLQSPSGEYQVRALQQKSKLTKSGKDKFSAEDMALKRLYTAEYEDRTRELSDKQGKRDTLIAQLKAKIDQARRAYEREEAIVRAKYPISSSYSEPTSDVVKAKCWEMYLAECNQKGVAPVLKTGVNLDLMYDKYNAAVRDTLLVEYLRRDEVKDMLHAFGVDKIKRLRTDGNEKLVNTFRGLLEITGGAATAPLPDEGEEDAVGDGAGGEDSPAGSGGADASLEELLEFEERIDEHHRRHDPETSAAQEHRKRRRSSESPKKKRKNKSKTERRKLKRQRHTYGEE
ncbi:TPA_asm: hypothetical protein [Alloteropsis semialata amalgavirus 1]|nr:TPA_asm: hypothetical protein [Alloteropsis semialata amalgavirus 1]